MSMLFSPLQLGDVTARNRVVVSPMCQYNSTNGIPGDWHIAQLGRYALGGAGIVFGEETATEARGRKTHQCAGLWDDAQIPAYRRMTDFLKAHGAVPAIQLGHSGRKGSVFGATQDWRPITPKTATPDCPIWEPIAPSAVPMSNAHQIPREMTVADIQAVVESFAAAIRRSLEAGYDIVEIHGAHGYLIHQFLSPITNRRGDAYGGDRANRMRFALEVAEAARAALPANPLFWRVSAIDGQGGAWDFQDTKALALELKAKGIDVIDCSSGGITGGSEMATVKRVPGYQVAFAEEIRREVGIQTMAVGLITEAEQAEHIVSSGQADLVALARELIWNPNWPAHAAKALGVNNPYDLMPEEFAFRLQRRDDVAKMPYNRV